VRLRAFSIWGALAQARVEVVFEQREHLLGGRHRAYTRQPASVDERRREHLERIDDHAVVVEHHQVATLVLHGPLRISDSAGARPHGAATSR